MTWHQDISTASFAVVRSSSVRPVCALAIGLPRAALLAAVAAWINGCAVGIGGTGAASVDTEGGPGGEGRAEAVAAVGSNDLRGYLSLAGGGGYLDSFGSGYGLVAPELGFETGDEIRFAAGPLYVARFLAGAATGPRHGVGGAGSLYFRLGSAAQEGSAVYLGPRLQIERVWGVDPEPDRALFSLGVGVRWNLFDSTSRPFSF